MFSQIRLYNEISGNFQSYTFLFSKFQSKMIQLIVLIIMIQLVPIYSTSFEYLAILTNIDDEKKLFESVRIGR